MPARTHASRHLRKKPAAVLLSCLALVAVLAFAAPAGAGPYTFRPGVVEAIVPNAPELSAMRSIGAKSVRITFGWDVIEVRRPGSTCASGVYNFSRHDSLVAAAAQRGVSILAVLGNSPRYAASFRAKYPTPGTAAFQDFQCFVRALVDRYGRGGPFLEGDIVDWQLWNEPSLPLYSPGGNVSPTKYGKLVKATSNTIRAQDARATIVLAGLPEDTRNGMNSNEFLRRMYRVDGIRSKFDVVAIHPYALNARGTKGALIRLRENLRNLNDSRRAVWVTEVGYGTAGPKGYALVTTEQGQADKLESTMRMLRSNRDRFKLGTVHWFSFRDIASYAENSGNWAEYAGIYRENGTPKPACVRYKRFTGAAGSCQAIQDGAGAAPLASTGGFDLGPRAAQLIPSAPEPPQE